MTLTAKDVAEITRLLEQSDFDELTLELDELKLTVRRNGAAEPATRAQSAAPGAVSAADAAPASAPPAGVGPAGAAAAEAAPVGASPLPAAIEAEAATQNVTAPLLGTFYRAPKPGAPPFVELGSAVEEHTIIGIIEVMKLMNTVRAGVRGRVVEIPATDGGLVEYGQTLIRVSQEIQG